LGLRGLLLKPGRGREEEEGTEGKEDPVPVWESKKVATLDEW